MAGNIAPMQMYALEDGSCKFLNEDNSCSIYETRPEICRIEEMQKESGIHKDAYFADSAKACNQIQEHFEVPVKFRVKL